MGNVPTWCAFGAAFCAAVFTWRALQRERRRDAHREGREARAQADQVAAWIVKADLESFPEHKVWVARIGNSSALPVFAIAFEVTMIPGWEPHYIYGAQPTGATIPPGSHYDIHPVTDDMSRHSVEELLVSVWFTDAAGVRWHRDVAGQLSQVPSEAVEERRCGGPSEPRR